MFSSQLTPSLSSSENAKISEPEDQAPSALLIHSTPLPNQTETNQVDNTPVANVISAQQIPQTFATSASSSNPLPPSLSGSMPALKISSGKTPIDEIDEEAKEGNVNSHFLAASLSHASSGSESVANYAFPHILSGTPYAKGFRKIKKHALYLEMKKLIGVEQGAVSINYASEHISKYIHQLGAVSSDPDLLIDETEPTIQFAKELALGVLHKNMQYKLDNRDAYVAKYKTDRYGEEIRLLSIIGVRINGVDRNFVSISGKHAGKKNEATKQLVSYLEEFVAANDDYAFLPEISPQFKMLLDYFAQSEFAIPNYDEKRGCAEFSYLANLAKLFFQHGKNMSITGIVNIPLAIAHMKSKPFPADSMSTERKLQTFSIGTPWQANGAHIEHWRCCDSCKNNKPLYLFMLGVMQDLGAKKAHKKLTINTDLPVLDSSDEELTSPVHARISKFMEDASKREAQYQTASASSATSSGTIQLLQNPSDEQSPIQGTNLLQRRSSKDKHFSFSSLQLSPTAPMLFSSPRLNSASQASLTTAPNNAILVDGDMKDNQSASSGFGFNLNN